jgi:orotidine-5'-phosphate decarboxylase
MSIQPHDRIIVPLDVPTEEAALALLDRLPEVRFWKVGLELFVSQGPGILKHLKQRQKKIFLDLKFHDIPNTVAEACRIVSGYGVDLITLHATAGKQALQAAQQAAQAGAIAAGHPQPQLLAVTLLTSLNSRMLAFELKIPLDLMDYVQQMALLAQDSGLAGVVCSPQEIEAVRQLCDGLRPANGHRPFLIICPGIRPTWASSGDQQRTLTPKAALKQGADYLVIGRPITQAPDPASAFQRIVDELT